MKVIKFKSKLLPLSQKLIIKIGLEKKLTTKCPSDEPLVPGQPDPCHISPKWAFRWTKCIGTCHWDWGSPPDGRSMSKLVSNELDLFLVNLKVVKERPENKRGQASWNQVPLSVFPAGADEIRDIQAHELLQDRLDTPCKQQKEEEKKKIERSSAQLRLLKNISVL